VAVRTYDAGRNTAPSSDEVVTSSPADTAASRVVSASGGTVVDAVGASTGGLASRDFAAEADDDEP
jgi:hypothetical protein